VRGKKKKVGDEKVSYLEHESNEVGCSIDHDENLKEMFWYVGESDPR
jgi:hypothetical protein